MGCVSRNHNAGPEDENRPKSTAAINTDKADKALLREKKRSEKALVIKKDQQQHQLQAIMQDRSSILKDMQAQMKRARDHLQRLKTHRDVLRRTVQMAKASSKNFSGQGFGKTFSLLKGRLSWPVSGQLIRHFRATKDINTRFDAVLIATPASKDVVAPAQGEVIFSDWLPHYGLLLIIKHDEHYLSLYGHNAVLYKKLHDVVKAGEVIAKTGDTGGQSRIALYFAIRRDNQALNPTIWCKSQEDLIGPNPNDSHQHTP